MFYSKDVSFLAVTWVAPLNKSSTANVGENIPAIASVLFSMLRWDSLGDVRLLLQIMTLSMEEVEKRTSDRDKQLASFRFLQRNSHTSGLKQSTFSSYRVTLF